MKTLGTAQMGRDLRIPTHLRANIYCIALIALLLAASASLQAGTVMLSVEAVGTGPGSLGTVVGMGCTVKIVVDAGDTDLIGSQVCWDYLEFPGWDTDIGSPPSRTPGGNYHGENIVTVDWFGPRTFNFTAADRHVCGGLHHEDDEQAQWSITITGVKLLGIEGPAGPFCPLGACPGGGSTTYQAVTDPENCGEVVTWSGTNGYSPPEHPDQWVECMNTPGTHTITAQCCGQDAQSVSVEVQSPVHEITLLEPDSAAVGGMFRIRVQMRTRCAGAPDPCDVPGACGVAVECEDPDEEDGWGCRGIVRGGGDTERTYVDGVTTEIFTYYWDTRHLKNGNYGMKISTTFYVGPNEEEVPAEILTSVNVKNLFFTPANPESLIVWRGDEGETETITVNLEDNDLDDPMKITLELWSTAMDNSDRFNNPPPVAATLVKEAVTGGSHPFTWDGNGGYAAPGLYTFSVVAEQTDICNGDPEVQVTDVAKYRSEHTGIVRAIDPETGIPVYEVDYEGYDDNGTADEGDDDYLYVIRMYWLVDSEHVCASEGQVWLYDPTLEKVGEYDIAGMDCLLHPGLKDGLCEGLHAIRIRVSVSDMQDAGYYRFVIHVTDDHADLYRNPANRLALDLNCEHKIHSYTVWMSTEPEIADDAREFGQNVAARLETLGYKPYDKNDNDPEDVGTGKLFDIEPRLAIRTLGRRSPSDPAWHDTYKRDSAIWMYAGHGAVTGYGGSLNTSWLEFLVPGSSAGIYVGHEIPASQMFNIDGFDLDSVRLVYLLACYSAGGTDSLEGTAVTVSRANSIGAHFDTAGTHTGARTVIAFHEVLHAEEDPYQEFHKVFWDGICKKEWTVGYSYGRAVEAAKNTIEDGKKKGMKYYDFLPDRFGHYGVKITPPRYGDEKSTD